MGWIKEGEAFKMVKIKEFEAKINIPYKKTECNPSSNTSLPIMIILKVRCG